MSAVQEIKSAIEQLSSFAKASEDRLLEERVALIADLYGWSDDEWDRQMKADAAAANSPH